MSPAVPSTAVLESLADRTASTARGCWPGPAAPRWSPTGTTPDGCVAVLAHGVSGEGSWSWRCPRPRARSRRPARPRCRLDVRVEAPQARVRIIAASDRTCSAGSSGRPTALGSRSSPDQALGPGPLSPRCRSVALGVVHSDRVLLHDTAGVTPYAAGRPGGTDGAPAFATTPRAARRCRGGRSASRPPTSSRCATRSSSAPGRRPVLSERPAPVDLAARRAASSASRRRPGRRPHAGRARPARACVFVAVPRAGGRRARRAPSAGHAARARDLLRPSRPRPVRPLSGGS